MIFKKCTRCKILKPLDNFGLDKNRKDGHNLWCKECICKSSRAYKKANPEKVRELAQKYWIKNRHKLGKIRQKRNAEYRKTNPIKHLENGRLWAKANPERVREHNRKANKKRRGTAKGALNHRMGNFIRVSLRGTKNGHHWEYLVGYTVEELKTHIEKQFKDGMSWELFHKGEIHIDHKIPLSVFNFSHPEDFDFKKAWSLKNLQPLWAKDNIRKNAKLSKPFQPSLRLRALNE